MRKSLFPAIAALGLAVVAGQTAIHAPTPAAPGDAAAGWHMMREGAMAKLAYGMADSDQLALMLTCAPGDSAAVVYGDVEPQSAALTLASLEPQPIDPLSGGETFEARLSLTDPALTGLAHGGRMIVHTEAGDLQLTANPAERRMVQGFLSYCASGHA